MTKDGVRSRLAATTIQGEAIRPVKAAPGEQAHALAVALDDQAVAVVFDLVQPVVTGGDLGPTGRDAGLENVLTHGAKIGVDLPRCEFAGLAAILAHAFGGIGWHQTPGVSNAHQRLRGTP